jgi:uncharacterized protein YndB with AHSA1/START domain
MNDASQDRAQIAGTVRAQDGKGVVRMDCRYGTDIDDLWSAISDVERLARWMATVKGDLRVGGAVHVRFTSTAEGPGRIDVCEPPQRLLVTMSPGTDDETVIEAVLTAEGPASTRLVVENRGLPLKSVSGYGAGWHTHLEDLAAYFAGDELSDWGARADELVAGYRDQAIAAP